MKVVTFTGQGSTIDAYDYFISKYEKTFKTLVTNAGVDSDLYRMYVNLGVQYYRDCPELYRIVSVYKNEMGTPEIFYEEHEPVCYIFNNTRPEIDELIALTNAYKNPNSVVIIATDLE